MAKADQLFKTDQPPSCGKCEGITCIYQNIDCLHDENAEQEQQVLTSDATTATCPHWVDWRPLPLPTDLELSFQVSKGLPVHAEASASDENVNANDVVAAETRYLEHGHTVFRELFRSEDIATLRPLLLHLVREHARIFRFEDDGLHPLHTPEHEESNKKGK
jgi:hypothetical protein